MARSRAVLAVFLTAALAGSLVGARFEWWPVRPGTASLDVIVTHVVDGDTIVVSRPDGGLETVRLLGVDTPETVHPDRPVECFGPEASAFTKASLTGARLRLETDVEARDRYGRLLAYAWMGGERFNDVLLRRGYGRLLVIAPNGRYARSMLRAQLAARAQHRGMWGACVT
jgi:micrococcal nuclease